jgi:hypothetical protein
MATSGTTTWKLQRDEVINGALRKLAVLSGGSTPETFEVTNAAQALNAMLKTFQADGMPVWAIKSYTFTTVSGTSSYTIGPTSTLPTPMPLKVLQAVRAVSGSYSNVPLNVYTNYDFSLLPLALSSGTPVNLYYQPFTNYGQISIWPKPDASNVDVTITYQRPFEDMNSSTDDFDFPSYWTEALIFGLAWRLSPEYGIPIQDKAELKQMAEFFHQQALSFGVEEGSVYFQPNRR